MAGNSQNWCLKQNQEIAGTRIVKSQNAWIPCRLVIHQEIKKTKEPESPKVSVIRKI